ncbi:exonuclease domain-containing protein [Apilactobacillus sp. TMW 2.2459]|uniref:exonuclease domain-containing protein n=1 Tax=Apilactobacillus xinyiensis TaxID=2841032 RepID=UPI00200EB8C8|nr:exonuclease domain-containing protein [Apilactobacillus xinyiensis]MCL0311724.1 exonuclease domain-containing protein [Apilactobacillus xinyiensis]
MMKDSTFSVVDIETTGSDMSEDANRIIQFSCTFVKNCKIIDSYNVYVNPMMSIPSRITDLTGIDNEKVSKAVTFDQVANKIYKMLENTIFVAHNINFDLPFLNKELIRAGCGSLKIKGYDTVTLSQILMPTMDSYRLRDLSSALNIVHEHPHSSASDALATAKIFILLSKYASKISNSIIKCILDISPSLPMNTIEFFNDYRDNNFESKLLCLKKGFVVRKLTNDSSSDVNEFKKIQNTYNTKINVKENSLEKSLFKNIKRSNVLVDSNVDSNNSVLKPIIYSNKSIIASENVNKVSRQISSLNKFTDFIVLHASNEYVDLEKLKNSLRYDSKSKKTKFIKCQILVWLTLTKTGLLSEINANYNDIDYFKEISCDEIKYNYYLSNFDNKLKQAHLIILDHSYLIENTNYLNSLIPLSQYNLVVDQATKFNADFLKTFSLQFQFNNIFTLIRKLQSDLHQTHYTNLYDVFNHSKNMDNIKIVDSILHKLTLKVELFTNNFKKSFLKKNNFISTEHGYSLVFKNDLLLTFFNENTDVIKSIDSLAAYLNKKLFNINSNNIIFNKFKCNAIDLLKFMHDFKKFRENMYKYTDAYTCLLTINKDKNIDNAYFEGNFMQSSGLIKSLIYDKYKNLIFIDSNWLIASCYDYIHQQLELNVKKTKKIIFKNKFSGNNKFLVFKGYNDKDSKIKFVNKLVEETDFKTFILTNSKISTENYYSGLHKSDLSDLYSIYARDITGNDYKILKKMSNHSRFVTIGNSELEYMLNLNNNADILIIDNLNDYFKNDYCNKSNVDVSRYTLHLYKNIMHFINVNADGTIIIWDDDISKLNFSKFFQKYIPNFKAVNSYIEN